jgi:hypothetical protein
MLWNWCTYEQYYYQLEYSLNLQSCKELASMEIYPRNFAHTKEQQ